MDKISKEDKARLLAAGYSAGQIAKYTRDQLARYTPQQLARQDQIDAWINNQCDSRLKSSRRRGNVDAETATLYRQAVKLERQAAELIKRAAELRATIRELRAARRGAI